MALEIVQLVEGEKTGAEALRDGVRVGHLVGRLDEAPSRGQHAWVELGDHGLAEGQPPALYADLYAVAGEPWVRQGHLTHLVEMPAHDEVLRVWFGLGFGQEQVYASAPTRETAVAPPPGVTVREATADDLERSLDVVGAITIHQLGPPVWSGLTASTRDELRAGWAEFLAEEDSVVLLAERDADVVGFAALHPGPEPRVAHLPVAATHPEARGAGIGFALAQSALRRAHTDGYRTVELDWRSTNLLASRFWLRAGFVPTSYRLRRDVQPYA
jgi:ribosomal protein S18 acetylase RimI-like enzyme